MTNRTREIAKFLSGLVVGDMLVAVWLLLEGHLPISVLGMEVTAETAKIGIGVDALLAIGLIYYAWFRAPRGTTQMQQGMD